ncbi:DUF1295 domain-containing protein [Kibdelosporangium lantanae]|uniref:DUF1295 domain-containing protein n=1 Tax=Kibdelosporangium lantanae TaxID=1497396 RepID=A0ABW3MJA6_9PSEU
MNEAKLLRCVLRAGNAIVNDEPFERILGEALHQTVGADTTTVTMWRYTRHPNYFGDSAVWLALYLLACTSWAGAATILSPAVMTWLLVAGSGKALTEKHMRKARPEYADYVARTSGFFPWPPKSGPAKSETAPRT